MKSLLVLLLLSVSFVFSQPGTALEFNGYDSYVNCGNSTSLCPSNSITLSAWIYPYSVHKGGTIIWRGDVSHNYYGIKISSDNRVRGTLFLDTYTHIWTGPVLTREKWNHIAITYDNSIPENNFKIYVNGILANQITAHGTIKWDEQPFYIGFYPYYNYDILFGKIARVGVWDRALSETEISQNMNTLPDNSSTGMVAFWPLDEGNGNIAHDITLNNNGYIHNALWSLDNFNYDPKIALEFNGYNSYVNCGSSSVLCPPNSITLSAWIFPYSLHKGGTIIWRGDVSLNYYGIKISSDNRVRGTLFLDSYTHIWTGPVLTRDKWNHIAFTYDNSLQEDNFKIYVNGVLKNKMTAHGTIKWDHLPFYIGYYPWGSNDVFFGKIGKVGLWNRALSGTEITQYMNSSPDSSNGLVAFWPLNEGSGDVAYDINKNNNGIINNASWSGFNNMDPVISSDSIWLDSDYNGFEAKRVSAENSSGNILSYNWTINNDTVATGINPIIELATGSHWLKLTVKDSDGNSVSDSTEINVFSAKLSTRGVIYSAPSQLNSELFLISSLDDKVYCFDSTGTIRWTYQTGGDIQSAVAVADTDNIFLTSSDTRLYSLNSTGIPNWDKAMGGVIVTSPSISVEEKSIYCGMTSGRLFKLNYEGSVNWSFQSQGSILSSSVIGSDGTVYFGSADKNLYALSPDKTFLWSFAALDSILSSPAIASDSSIVFGSRDGYLYKLNKNGSLAWKYNTEGIIYSSPVIDVSGNIYIGSMGGYFYAFSPDGTMLWKFKTISGIRSTASFSVDGQGIYFGCDNGNLYALSISGNELWTFNSGAPVYAPTLVTMSNLIYIANANGEIYILKALPQQYSEIPPVCQWPTFQGNNQRTGKVSALISSVNNTIVPHEFALIQNFPNPFNPSTQIRYSIPSVSSVQLRIYNSLGQLVKDFGTEIKQAGSYHKIWNADNNSSGIYFYELNASSLYDNKNFHQVNKMILLK